MLSSPWTLPSFRSRLSALVFLLLWGAGPAGANPIDFEGFAVGAPITSVGDVTFGIQPQVGLEVGAGLSTTSGVNYLAASTGDGSFLSGDVIRLDFAVPVQSLAVTAISTALTPTGAFTLFTTAGSDVSAGPDGLLGIDEVHVLSVDAGAGGTPFRSAELRALPGAVFAFNLDDIVWSVPVPEPGLALFAVVFAVFRVRGGRSRPSAVPGSRRCSRVP